MRIQQIKLTNFKRFTNLTIAGVPKTAKLVVLAGPNGIGKSSLFDGLHAWHQHAASGQGANWDNSYHVKHPDNSVNGWNRCVDVQFHDLEKKHIAKNAIYVRTAYRNQPDFEIRRLERKGAIVDEVRFHTLVDNDASVGANYERLVAQGVSDLFGGKIRETTFGQYYDAKIAEVGAIMTRMFPGLVLSDLGDPLAKGTFFFDKGVAKKFRYKNLSGGEKAAFDLILDLAVKRRDFDDTVFCIDEPEAHMGTRLQGTLLQELYDLLPENSQLWVATHSIGMMRKARDLQARSPDEIVFIDFDGHDFDQPHTLTPVKPTRAFWERVLSVALDDLAELVAPSDIVVCEGQAVGGRNAQHDAHCYETIFADEFPDTRFLSGGNCHDVESDRLALLQAIQALVRGCRVTRLRDRDELSSDEVDAKRRSGIRVLSRRNLECYLFDDDILAALCRAEGKPEAVNLVLAAKAERLADLALRESATDDLKKVAPLVYQDIRKILKLQGRGSDARAFMRSTLAPLVKPGMAVYDDLKRDVFGATTVANTVDSAA